MFRVQAVNAYGLSDESQESAPLFIDAALSKCTALLTSVAMSLECLQESSDKWNG